MPTFTSNYSIPKPVPGADADSWGAALNSGMDIIDTQLAGRVTTASLATGVAAFLATPTSANLAAALTDETGTGANVFATSPTLVTPILGTPTSGTLTNCTGLPISTGISGLATGVAAFLATPTSANLASAVTDETGSGALVFGTSPTIATPTITTSATVPLVIGGTGTTSTLTLRSTSGVGTTGADIIFQAGNNGATEVMRLQNGGNVGIGTSSPSWQTTVYGTGQNTALLTDAGSKSASLFVGSSNGSAGAGGAVLLGGIVANGVTSQWAIKSIMTSTTANGTADLAFSTRAGTGDTTLTERMRIDSSGNVGIGTSSPSWQTTVYGTGQNTALLTDAGSKSASLFVGSSNGSAGAGGAVLLGGIVANGVTSQWAIKSIMTSTTANGTADLAFSTRAGTGDTTLTERMRIDSSGNVGIGTASPQRPLDVRKAGTAGNTLILQNLFNTESSYQVNSGSGLLFQYGGGHSQAMISGNIESNGSGANGYLSLCTTTDGGATMPERMRITSGGNVKVGGTADRATTAGTNQVVIFNGTAPVGTLANGCSFYSTAGEMRVMDAAGNATLLSPHDSVTNEWIYDSSHTPSGKRLKINVERLLRFINDHFGLDCVHDLMEEA